MQEETERLALVFIYNARYKLVKVFVNNIFAYPSFLLNKNQPSSIYKTNVRFLSLQYNLHNVYRHLANIYKNKYQMYSRCLYSTLHQRCIVFAFFFLHFAFTKSCVWPPPWTPEKSSLYLWLHNIYRNKCTLHQNDASNNAPWVTGGPHCS